MKFYWRKIWEDNLGCLVKKTWLLKQHQPCQPQLKQKCNQEKLLEMFTFTSSLQIKAASCSSGLQFKCSLPPPIPINAAAEKEFLSSKQGDCYTFTIFVSIFWGLYCPHDTLKSQSTYFRLSAQQICLFWLGERCMERLPSRTEPC